MEFELQQSCMAFVQMFAVAVLIRVTTVETMLGAMEFYLVPFLPSGIFLDGLLVLVEEA